MVFARRGRYDKLTKKYPTVGILKGNGFRYVMTDIDVAEKNAEIVKAAAAEKAKEAAAAS